MAFEVRCFRIGTYPRINYTLKGGFTKKFETIEELVKFVFDNRNRLIVKWSRELNSEQIRIFKRKYNAMNRKMQRRLRVMNEEQWG